jgi:hypothetical protein
VWLEGLGQLKSLRPSGLNHGASTNYADACHNILTENLTVLTLLLPHLCILQLKKIKFDNERYLSHCYSSGHNIRTVTQLATHGR